MPSEAFPRVVQNYFYEMAANGIPDGVNWKNMYAGIFRTKPLPRDQERQQQIKKEADKGIKKHKKP